MRALLTQTFVALILFGAAPAIAQDEPAPAEGTLAESAAEERAAQFVGVTGPDAETVPGGTLLIAAYGVVWVLLFLYLFRMRGLQRDTAEELERLATEVRAIEGG